jgi:hypothetical protein
MKEKSEVLISATTTDRIVLVLENFPGRDPGKEGYDSERSLFWFLVSEYPSLL